MGENEEMQKPAVITEMSVKQILQSILGGAIVGAIAGGLTIVFALYVFKVMPCYEQGCGAGGQYAAVLASIASAAVALFWLIKIQVFRPLLIVIAVTIALWGLSLEVLHWPWYVVVAISAALHAIAYGLFAWVSRIRFFWLVILLLMAIIVAVRLILSS